MISTVWVLVGFAMFAVGAHAQETTSVKIDRYSEMEENDLIRKLSLTLKRT